MESPLKGMGSLTTSCLENRLVLGKEVGALRGGGRMSFFFQALDKSGLDADRQKLQKPRVVVGCAGLCALKADGEGFRTGGV